MDSLRVLSDNSVFQENTPYGTQFLFTDIPALPNSVTPCYHNSQITFEVIYRPTIHIAYDNGTRNCSHEHCFCDKKVSTFYTFPKMPKIGARHIIIIRRSRRRRRNTLGHGVTLKSTWHNVLSSMVKQQTIRR